MSFSATYQMVLAVIGAETKTTEEVLTGLEVKAKAQNLTLGLDNTEKIKKALVKLETDAYLTRADLFGKTIWSRTAKSASDSYLKNSLA